VLDRRGDAAAEEADTCRVVGQTVKVKRDHSIRVRMPGDSTLTIVCEIEPAARGADGECDADGRDSVR
jgi:hypothetical protein